MTADGKRKPRYGFGDIVMPTACHGSAEAANLTVPFRVFDQLPEPLADPAGPPPSGTALAVSSNLPPRLARFQPRSMERGNPIIDTPADGAELVVTASGVALRGRGGPPPYEWVVDGHPVGPPADAIERIWHPDGRGAAQLELVDGQGRSATIVVWVASL